MGFQEQMPQSSHHSMPTTASTNQGPLETLSQSEPGIDETSGCSPTFLPSSLRQSFRNVLNFKPFFVFFRHHNVPRVSASQPFAVASRGHRPIGAAACFSSVQQPLWPSGVEPTSTHWLFPGLGYRVGFVAFLAWLPPGSLNQID